jgi:predicted flap endonuclease-1-like 5' DNA nuclease
MFFAYILLQSTFQQDLPVGLALCIVPAIIGWLAAYSYYKVGSLKGQIASLTEENTGHKAKIDSLSSENTDLRVKLTQCEAEIERLNETLRKAKNDLIICESDRNVLQSKLDESGKSSKAGQTITFAGAKYKWDDLKIVEGIGPKIAELLINAGIKTWKALSETGTDRLREILDAAGSSYQIHDPGTWPDQSRLAEASDWDGLKKLQDELKGGRVE